MKLRSLDANGAAGQGILCFSNAGDQLCQFLREVSRNGDERVLALATSDAIAEDWQAWELLRAGASDVLVWSAKPDLPEQIKARFERWRAVDAIISSSSVRDRLVGVSPVWRSALRQIVEVARFTAASVLLIGESGTGKELVARLVHELDPRASKNEFVILDCTTVVPELSGSEFFGHERGAFTGAVAAREGAFAQADGGTLFLDEVGELPPTLQAQLLRVVQEGTYKRVGSSTWHQTKFRLVGATNKDLLQGFEAGEFRRDLYYRIASWVFRMPSLRERREDILPLARHFLPASRPGMAPLDFDVPVRQYLAHRPYPGNVRDLQQLILRIGSRHCGPGPITLGDVPVDERPADGPGRHDWRGAEFDQAIRNAVALGAGLKEISQAAAETAIRIAVHEEDGNLKLAAHRLHVTDRALQMRRASRWQHKA